MITEQLIIFNYICILSQAACRAGMRPSPLTQWNWMKALAMSASMSVTYTGLLCSVQSSLKDLRIQMLWASPPPWWKALCLCNSATLFSWHKTTTQWNSRELIDATVISWYSLGCSAFSLVFTAGFTTSGCQSILTHIIFAYVASRLGRRPKRLKNASVSELEGRKTSTSVTPLMQIPQTPQLGLFTLSVAELEVSMLYVCLSPEITNTIST